MRTADPELHQQRRSEILSAAAVCFAAKGIHQASMADIAKAAKVSMGLLYRYFQDKAEIVVSFASLERELAQISIQKFAQSPTPMLALNALVTEFIGYQTQPDVARLSCEVIAEASRNKAVLAAIQNDDQLLKAALIAAFTSQQVAGRIAKVHTPLALTELLMTFFDGCIGRCVCDATFDAKQTSSAFLEVLAKLLTL